MVHVQDAYVLAGTVERLYVDEVAWNVASSLAVAFGSWALHLEAEVERKVERA